MKVRKLWFIWTILTYVVPAIVITGIGILGSFAAVGGATKCIEIVVSALGSLLVGALSILILYFYYRCAYKNPGTKLLFFTLLLGSMGIASQLFAVKVFLHADPSVNFLSFIPLASSACHLVLTYYMRKNNLLLIREELRTCSVYINFIANLEQATSSDGIDILYREVSTKVPPYFMGYLTKAYKAKRKQLV